VLTATFLQRGVIHTLVVAAALAGCAAREPWSLSEGQHAARVHRSVTRKVEAEFLLYLPAGFAAHGGRRFPLLIFLHGSGESGRDIAAVLRNGPPKLVAAGHQFPFIIASPQAHEDWPGFDFDALNAMLDEIIGRLPIDTDRIYLTGLSMGGEWSYGWASMNPERFAAIAPVGGAWNPVSACALKRVPVWAFHGAKDDVIPLDSDRAMIDAINRCGGTAKLSVYDDIGHDVWNAAYAEPELYAWLLRQKRIKDRP